MPRVSRSFLACLIASLSFAALRSGADDKSTNNFAPVAPARSVGRVVKLNLDQVERWCDENDLTSAAQTAQSTVVLATFLSRHADQKSKANAEQLVRDCTAIGSAARSKNPGQTRASVTAAKATLVNLLPQLSEAKASWVDFKPAGGVRAWMILLDAGYADAKIADQADDFEALALTLAEECNVVGQLRKDARWRELSVAARDAALVAAKESHHDLPKARQTLRTMYARCESCHKAYQR
jgi:hypothetical protein